MKLYLTSIHINHHFMIKKCNLLIVIVANKICSKDRKFNSSWSYRYLLSILIPSYNYNYIISLLIFADAKRGRKSLETSEGRPMLLLPRFDLLGIADSGGRVAKPLRIEAVDDRAVLKLRQSGLSHGMARFHWCDTFCSFLTFLSFVRTTPNIHLIPER